jgi:oxygen-independent coproporphyrinogen-3 oxidase
MQYRGEFVDALVKEIDQKQDYLNDKSVNTIYFGGGTPSMFSALELNRVIDKISAVFEVQANAEITLEANPDDLDNEKLTALKNDTSINRLSLGVQSFFDDDLTYLNRVHGSSQARKAIELSIKHGFKNMTIDLIYGIPTLTDEKWKKNLEIFFSYQLPHLSSYSLTVEPKTALNVLINKGKMKNVDEEQSIRHFKILLEQTEKQAYEHYEISNFAKEGFYSKHNSIYWLGGHYLGLGPSAHSFNGISRQWNVSNMKQYIDSTTVENMVAEKEVLTKEQQFNEYVMTSLRTSWGCDIEHIENVFGRKYVVSLEQSMSRFTNDKKVQKSGNKYFLTNKGKLFADGIAAELFR